MLDYDESVFFVFFLLLAVGHVRCMAFFAAFLGVRWLYALRSCASIAICICTGHVSARIRSVSY